MNKAAWFATSTIMLAGFGVLALRASPSIAQTAPAPAAQATYLCDEASARPRILVGRFAVFDSFEPNRSQRDEVAFVGSVVRGLLERRDALGSVFVWSHNSADLRRYKEIAPLIEEAFVGEAAVDPGDDRRQNDLARELAASLLKNNCDYLLGGRIAKEGNLVRISPYLFETAKSALERFPAATVDTETMFKVPEQIARVAFASIEKRRRIPARPRSIAVGCLKATAVATMSRDAEVLANLVRRRLSQELSALNFSTYPLKAPDVCDAAAPDNPPDAAAIASGELIVATEKIEMQPLVRIIDRDDKGNEVKAIEVLLPSSARPLSTAIGLPAIYARELRTLLLAASKNGVFPEIDRAVAPESSEALLSLWPTVPEEWDAEQAALAAYRELTQRPSSRAGYYVLGNVLFRKDEKELALEQFLKAEKGQGDLPPEIDARLNESIGEGYFGIKEHSEAARFFATAKGLYEKLSKDADGRRVGRKLATARFLGGDVPGAIEAARDQRNLEGDKQSLVLLARFQAISEDFEEAERWLQKALLIDPADSEVKNQLAEVHAKAGSRDLARKNYVDARRHFSRALENRDDAGVRYMSGYAAYEINAYADAIRDFRQIVQVPTEKASLQWTEAAWLMLLECYLLTDKFDEVEKTGPAAEKATVRLTDPRAVINYLRFVAHVLKNPSVPADRLAEEPTYKELQTDRSASAKKLDWSDGKISVFIGKRDLKPDTKQVLDQARQALLR